MVGHETAILFTDINLIKSNKVAKVRFDFRLLAIYLRFDPRRAVSSWSIQNPDFYKKRIFILQTLISAPLFGIFFLQKQRFTALNRFTIEIVRPDSIQGFQWLAICLFKRNCRTTFTANAAATGTDNCPLTTDH
ncbi:MAG TPA: hypothetical protein PKE06_08830 [Flavilitoribacter sp.]|nr:hypothetical protein [Flavilitoribacter sp.]HMQ89144.1 hypothetical protein [Flavilitoribacter sp.]